MSFIPDKVYDYRVYDANEQLIGITGEVALPNLEATTSTLSGAGILGEMESVNIGHFGSTTVELTMKTLFQKSFDFLSYSGQSLILRAAQLSVDSKNGLISKRGLKITMKWQPKGLDLGKLSTGAQTESKNSLEVFYIKVEENGKELLELDKLNYIYRVNGKDQLADIKKLL
ncbi:phage major tail tube protein [Niallia taxi]|uniref:phage major tail tube protein n=1 Tax=Niallia taxi TaxID=2499688 RepID=UPI002E1A0AFC|nr:phage major tail tube protein [Niallia taxi]